MSEVTAEIVLTAEEAADLLERMYGWQDDLRKQIARHEKSYAANEQMIIKLRALEKKLAEPVPAQSPNLAE